MECRGYLCYAIGLIGSNNCSEKYCFCYHMSKENGMNLFEFALKVTVLNDEENVPFEFMMKKFTSRTFTHLLTKSGIHLSIKMKAFVDTTAMGNAFIDNLEALFESVNENGGWNVIGWMRSGRQKDQNSESGGRGDSTTIESGVIKF